jgi:hypothetical protein
MIEVLKQALTEAKRNERHNNVAETRYWFNQYKLIAEQAIAQLALDAKAENARELGLDYEPVCPECKAGVLYECVACSSNNYPPQRTEGRVCCQQYDICLEPCTSRGRHLAQRTWRGLTDDEHCDIWYKESLDWMEYGKAIEAKLKQKNGYAEEKNT